MNLLNAAEIHIAPHLRYREYCCPCCGLGPMTPELAEAWRILRVQEYGNALLCVSGFRCEDHNRQVGGQASSKHLLGEAMDLAPVNELDWVWIRSTAFLRAAFDSGFRGVGRGFSALGNPQLHVDVNRRGKPDQVMTIWDYEGGKPCNYRTVHRTSL